MDEKENKPLDGIDFVEKSVTTDRWLLNTGVITSSVENNLVLYGYLSSPDVLDVHIELNVEAKTIHYTLSMAKNDVKKYQKFLKRHNKYKDSKSLWGKYQQLRLLKYRLLDVEANIQHFIKDYLPEFKVNITLKAQKVAPRWLAWLFGMPTTKKGATLD
jgi:hypothetical protein